MNKELTPLEALNNLIEGLEDEHLGLSESEWVVESKQVIETALKRLKNYEQNEDFSKDVLNYAFLNEQDKIKKLKALEIIKPYCLVADYKTDDPDTRYELAFCKKICITQEEYDLLKEVLL